MAVPRSKLLFKVIPVIKNNIYIPSLAMPIARLPLLPVFCFLKAGRIAEFLAVGTPHLTRGVIRVHIGNVGQKGIVIVEKIRANSKSENKQSWFEHRYGRQTRADARTTREEKSKQNSILVLVSAYR